MVGETISASSSLDGVYKVTFDRRAVKIAAYMFFASFCGGLLAGVLLVPYMPFAVSIAWGFQFGLLLGSGLAASFIVVGLLITPRKLIIDYETVTMVFWVRPAVKLYFFEIDEIFLTSDGRMPALRRKGKWVVHPITFESAKALLERMSKS